MAVTGGKNGDGARCGAKTRSGKVCGRPSGWGTNHVGVGRCKLHGGSTPTQIVRAQRDIAKQAVETYGLPRTIDPHAALLEELARTAGHVAWLGQVVGSIDEDDLVGPVGVEGKDEQGLIHHPKAEPSIWVSLYQGERKHLTEVAATCIKAGIEERRVRIAEEQGTLIAQVIQGVLADLKISIEVARPVVRKHLALVASNED